MFPRCALIVKNIQLYDGGLQGERMTVHPSLRAWQASSGATDSICSFHSLYRTVFKVSPLYIGHSEARVQGVVEINQGCTRIASY